MQAAEPSQLPSWIQAAAAVVQAVFAVVLWKVTARYVSLTQDLAKTAARQLDAMTSNAASQQSADTLEFAYLAKKLSDTLRSLPPGPNAHNYGYLIRTIGLWSEDDLARLAVLSARAGERFASPAAQAAIDLAWLRDKVIAVKNDEPRRGYHLANFPWPDWFERYHRAKDILDASYEEAAKASKSLVHAAAS